MKLFKKKENYKKRVLPETSNNSLFNLNLREWFPLCVQPDSPILIESLHIDQDMCRLAMTNASLNRSCNEHAIAL